MWNDVGKMKWFPHGEGCLSGQTDVCPGKIVANPRVYPRKTMWLQSEHWTQTIQQTSGWFVCKCEIHTDTIYCDVYIYIYI